MRKTAFTLAEVLITLVIIGVIAAMTIPSVLNNTNKQEYRTALKKAVSTINQAVTMHYALEGMAVSDYTTEGDVSTKLFQKRLNVVGTTKDGSTYDGDASNIIYTADGIAYSFKKNATCDQAGTTICYTVYVDVNGAKNPNTKTAAATDPKDGYILHLYAQRATAGDDITQKVLYDSGLYSNQ